MALDMAPSSWRVGLLLLSSVALCEGCFFFDTSEGPPPPEPVVGPECGDTSELTPGELGLLEFAYDHGAIGCLFGCSASEPIAERAHVQVAAYGDVELPPLEVMSDAPDVATFEIGDDGDIHVETHAPGQARLELRDGASGELLEALPLTVKPVTSIASEDAGGVMIMVGGETSAPIDLLDERGCRMVGVGGVDYMLEGGIGESQLSLVDALAAWLFEGVFGSPVTEHVSIDALGLGSGVVAVHAPSGAALQMPVSVVDASAASTVTLRSVEAFMVGSSHSVDATVLDANGAVIRSPACTWALSPATGPVELSSEGRDTAYVTASAPGDASVSCTVGSAAGQLAVAFR